MSETTHTPGPWADTDEVYHEDELAVQAGDAVVASVWPMGDDEEGNDIQRANARLVAAAPELLAACKDAATELREFIDDCIEDPNDFDYRVVKLIESAIAKAEGRADG